jgi:hypothetical protein
MTTRNPTTISVDKSVLASLQRLQRQIAAKLDRNLSMGELLTMLLESYQENEVSS